MNQPPDKLTCDFCAEVFKTDLDLEAHLFNNKHCNPPGERADTGSRIDDPDFFTTFPD